VRLYLVLFFLLSSCYSIDGRFCSTPSEYTRSQAEDYYNSFGVFRERLSDAKAKKLFGCNFNKTTDYIYSYKTFWGKKLILVRYGKAVTWAEDDKRLR
jgi:hypothetical protein